MKPFITICSLLLLMASCQSSTEEPIPPKPPIIEPPVEVGEPLLFEPEEMVTITVGDETFMVDFSLSIYMQNFYDLPYDYAKDENGNVIRDENGNAIFVYFPTTTREGYIDHYEQRVICLSNGAHEGHEYCISRWVKAEYTLAQECFSDRCDSETRKEILRLVIDKQRRKYSNVVLNSVVHSGVFLMAVILLKERVYSAKHIDSETLQEALLFLNNIYVTIESMRIDEDFSDLIIECALNFLNDNN
jgi:hypothetical protein